MQVAVVLYTIEQHWIHISKLLNCSTFIDYFTCAIIKTVILRAECVRVKFYCCFTLDLKNKIKIKNNTNK